MYNGFQTEGKITERNNDTLKFQTDITNLFIPVKDIKFVLNPEVELSDLEEIDTLDYNKIIVPVVKVDTTEECDIYMDNKSELSGVKLIIDTDSTLKTIKDKKTKIINIAGIRKIVFKTSAPFGNGYLTGSLVGLGVGFLTGILYAHGSSSSYVIPGSILLGLITSIPAGLIGGVIGVLSANDEVYLFDKGITPMKSKRIRYAMEKHY